MNGGCISPPFDFGLSKIERWAYKAAVHLWPDSLGFISCQINTLGIVYRWHLLMNAWSHLCVIFLFPQPMRRFVANCSLRFAENVVIWSGNKVMRRVSQQACCCCNPLLGILWYSQVWEVGVSVHFSWDSSPLLEFSRPTFPFNFAWLAG